MKIVINKCYGGFGLSDKALEWLKERGVEAERSYLVDRLHPLVIDCVEALGEEANGPHAKLRIVEFPDDIEWEIEEYDGIERIAEKHRTWG